MSKKKEKVDGTSPIGSLSCEGIVTFLDQNYNISEVLYHFDSDDLRDHIVDEYFIADDEKDAAKILIDSGEIEMPFENSGRLLPDFRKKDTIELIERIVDKEGWNSLYDLLDWYRNRINIP